MASPINTVGFLTGWVTILFSWLKLLSIEYHLGLSDEEHLEARGYRRKVDKRDRAFVLTERYVICWLTAELLAVIYVCVACSPVSIVTWVARIGALLRIIEILLVNANVSLFDRIRGRPDEGIGSLARLLILAGINFIELILCFGIVYATNLWSLGSGRLLTPSLIPSDGIYLSAITQMTIGYGDVYPLGWLRAVASIQGLAGTAFIVLVFGRALTSLGTMNELKPGNGGRWRRRKSKGL